ncbi:MAG TPA: tetratricopeptide repeat protein [Chthoniobacterales bacterium]|nr:tetratricopeptide repeat protein [Chthoniobacterales bacterium]
MKAATDAPPAHVYEFGDFRLDARKRLLWRDGTTVRLAPRVFETLLFLVEHHDTVLDKERLMEAVWPDSIVEENNLTQNISALRRVFGETPGSHHYIVTVPGRGYRFVADVKMREAHRSPPPLRIPEPAIPPAENGVEQAALVAEPNHRGNLRSILLTTAALLVLSVAALFFWRGRTQIPPETTARIASSKIVIPEKSIAVLPFANLSADKENAFFTEGVQDDILTALAKFGDLKVISRTSVTSYVAGPSRNLREIGQELGVAHILEGSVRRVNGKVRVTAQLIETHTNTHLWAETYDRDLADVFAIQSDIAQRIANALQAKLAPDEQARLDARPTSNPEAYVLYLTARGTENYLEAEKIYLQAIALDPGFALAYAHASILNSRVSVQDPTRKARARALAEEALRLSPALGEAHMALGLCLYWAEKNYDAALKEFENAAATSPNNAEIYTYIGGIYRRQGRWRESIASFDRALSLDPRNHGIAFMAANNYLFVRDWATASAGFNRALALRTDFPLPKIGLAYLEVFRNGNPSAGRKILENMPASVDTHGIVTVSRWDLAMIERDYATAEKILTDTPLENFSQGAAPKTYYQGRLARARGDADLAQRYLAAGSADCEKRVRDNPGAAELHAYLALLYAYMQRKDDAIREARRAVELEPESQNAFHGAVVSANLALVYALVGEPDQAITLIERLLATAGPVQCSDYPHNITLADLRLRWEWDALRDNPRFQKILAEPEPKTVLTGGR